MIREPHHVEDVKSYLIEGSRDVAVLDTGTGAGDFPVSLPRSPRGVPACCRRTRTGTTSAPAFVSTTSWSTQPKLRRFAPGMRLTATSRSSHPNRSIPAGFPAISIPAPGFPVAPRRAGSSMETASTSATAYWRSFIPPVTRQVVSPFSTGRRGRSSSAICSIWARCSFSFRTATRPHSASHSVWLRRSPPTSTRFTRHTIRYRWCPMTCVPFALPTRRSGPGDRPMGMAPSTGIAPSDHEFGRFSFHLPPGD